VVRDLLHRVLRRAARRGRRGGCKAASGRPEVRRLRGRLAGGNRRGLRAHGEHSRRGAGGGRCDDGRRRPESPPARSTYTSHAASADGRSQPRRVAGHPLGLGARHLRPIRLRRGHPGREHRCRTGEHGLRRSGPRGPYAVGRLRGGTTSVCAARCRVRSRGRTTGGSSTDCRIPNGGDVVPGRSSTPCASSTASLRGTRAIG
jgi:hypothetical protein